MSIVKAAARALGQLDDPAFRKVILIGFALSLGIFALLLGVLVALVPLIPDTGVGWLDGAIGWLAGLGVPLLFVLVLYLLFPAVMTTCISFFVDDVVDAVEAKHYPQAAGWRRSPLIESIWLALKLSVVIVLVNALFLPLYIALLFTGLGSLVLYWLVNGYLLGREYFEIVAIRHARPRQAKLIRRQMRDRAFLGGLAIAGLFLVPVVNLLAPVLGTAMMVHLFHGAQARREAVS